MSTSIIHILPSEVANKIAAGEVVQRPASVVKELVENALDAGARQLSIIVKDAGRTSIQVIDDGSGMSSTDAPLAFQRHATSKISRAEDLEQIRTLGFRGEALASIAAVSRVELRTRTESDDVGTSVTNDGTESLTIEKVAVPRGTSVTVRNLFFNTPARRQFLKSDRTELRNIVDVVTRAAVSHPEKGWRLVSEGETLLDVPPQTSLERVAALLGENVGTAMLECNEQTEYVVIRGFVARPAFARKSRAEQYIFLNGRPITSRMISHAVYQAYEHLLIHGGYPLFVLHIDLDPRHVDVNVHPSKQEVKFDDESSIYRLVLSVVRKTLSSHDLMPTVSVQDGLALADERMLRGGVFTRDAAGTPAPIFPFSPEPTAAGVQTTGASSILRMRPPGGAGTQRPEMETIEHERVFPPQITETQLLWQVQNKYIVALVRTGLVIVDQHVAHERILYERVQANFEDAIPVVQQLLFPQTVELSASDYALIKELEEPLKTLGFDLRVFGRSTVIIEGIPADVKVGNEKRILQDVLEDYKKNDLSGTVEVRDRLAKSFACKAAIKAGDPLTTTEMKVLIEQLFLTQMPYVCPHGRPVIIRIPIEELDRRFGRT